MVRSGVRCTQSLPQGITTTGQDCIGRVVQLTTHARAVYGISIDDRVAAVSPRRASDREVGSALRRLVSRRRAPARAAPAAVPVRVQLRRQGQGTEEQAVRPRRRGVRRDGAAARRRGGGGVHGPALLDRLPGDTGGIEPPGSLRRQPIEGTKRAGRQRTDGAGQSVDHIGADGQYPPQPSLVDCCRRGIPCSDRCFRARSSARKCSRRVHPSITRC